MDSSPKITKQNTKLLIKITGELGLNNLSHHIEKLNTFNLNKINTIQIDLKQLVSIDTSGALFLNNFIYNLEQKNITVNTICDNQKILDALKLTSKKHTTNFTKEAKSSFLESLGKKTHSNYLGFLLFVNFLGELFGAKISYLTNPKLIRFKEIAFEINESAIKAFGIIALTSFLIGLVVAYQGAYQLKMYGANIFIVDMLGISLLRELSPMITAIVIAGRSGSAYTAQIGAMKITQELDAMKTMGFEPFAFLVLPRIIALMISMPILIFISDIFGVFGGMVIANIDLGITSELFLTRFSEVISVKHFFIGILKGPFFAFLIASIGIYRGLMVKDDTQSIGFNTTKSVVESIFAVIVCDAVFSIIFTNLGI